MNKSVISKSEPVNTNLIIGGKTLLFRGPSVGVNRVWQAEKMSN